MALQFESSQVIDRPIDKVFHFFAVEHVRNHPRWDPDIELWLDTTALSVLARSSTGATSAAARLSKGRWEVVEYEPNRALGMVIHDGPAVMHGRTTFEAINANQRVHFEKQRLE